MSAPTNVPTSEPSSGPTNGIFVSQSGSDSNSGTIGSPYKTITKAQSVASSGSTVYLRGGTYSGFSFAGSDSTYNFVNNITKSGITYEGYPGETPVLDFSGTATDKRVAAFHIAGRDSNGFKIGGWGSSTVPSSVPVHTVKYCLSANNNASGFYANHQPGKSADWSYNTSYSNHPGFNMLERVSTTDATDVAGTREVLHFNIAFSGTMISNSNLPASSVSDNSWTNRA